MDAKKRPDGSDGQFVYDRNARELDKDLEDLIDSHKEEKAESAAQEEVKAASEVTGLDAIAQEKTPLDEVRAIIKAKQDKDGVAKKLAELRLADALRYNLQKRAAARTAVDQFLSELE